MDSAGQIYCKAPYVWQAVTPGGDILPCCSYRGNLGRVNAFDENKLAALKEAHRHGERLPECKECWHREDIGVASARQLIDNIEIVPAGLRVLEFNLSNLCNLKCRMCDGDSSSAWVADEIALRAHPATAEFRRRANESLQTAFESDDALLSYLDSLNLSRLVEVCFKGGEPLLHPQAEIILNYLLKKNQRDLCIRITSNTTVLRPRFLEKLKEFRQVVFVVSVDATGFLHQYIRGGTKYPLSVIANNVAELRRLKNISLQTISCIGAFNIFGLADLYEWQVQHITGVGQNNVEDFVQSQWGPVWNPDYLSVRALPLFLRERAAEMNMAALRAKGLLNQKLEAHIRGVLDLSVAASPQLTEHFLTFTRTLDKIRGDSFVEAAPQFKELFDGRAETTSP